MVEGSRPESPLRTHRGRSANAVQFSKADISRFSPSMKHALPASGSFRKLYPIDPFSRSSDGERTVASETDLSHQRPGTSLNLTWRVYTS